MKRQRLAPIYKKSAFGQGLQAGVVSVVLILVIALMIWNTSGLYTVFHASTQQYVKDVSYQLTNDISARLATYEMALSQLADSISKLPDEIITDDFLHKKAEIAGFDAMIVVDESGSSTSSIFDKNGLKDRFGIKSAFQGESSIMFLEGQTLLFSTPIYEADRISRVLAGICKKENMQALIQPKSFEGHGLSCVIDDRGNVVISPTDVKPFIQLDHIFKEGTDVKAAAAIGKMQEDIKNETSGVFEFTAINDTRLVLAYHGLGINDWSLLTLVSADLISGEANAYVYRMFLIVGGVILVFALFLAALLKSYRNNRKRLELIAFRDSLTGGMNNAAFQMQCRKLIENAPPSTYSVVLLNVKRFKYINENYGIEAGDETLQYMYSVLQRHIRTEEALARNHADHFFLCLKESDPEKIQLRLNGMIDDINSFHMRPDIPFYFEISRGAALVDQTDLDITIVQDRARAACQHGVADTCTFYHSDLMELAKREQELNAMFGGSIQNHDFYVYLQPKVNLKNDSVCGAEALVRWISPKYGTILPSDFIPIFEKNGNICKLDLYVFEEVCRWIQRRIDEGKELIPVSVNLSRINFRNLDFLHSYAEMKERYGVPDNLIELELTESIFFDAAQIELVKNTIHQMHTYGFLCSLDDFGFGFSSLALLKEFDVDTIKLDRSFFGDISNEKTQKVISSLVELAQKLGIHIVAEGIETKEQLNYLMKIGCEMVQGYIFSKPLSISEFEQWCEKK